MIGTSNVLQAKKYFIPSLEGTAAWHVQTLVQATCSGGFSCSLTACFPSWDMLFLFLRACFPDWYMHVLFFSLFSLVACILSSFSLFRLYFHLLSLLRYTGSHSFSLPHRLSIHLCWQKKKKDCCALLHLTALNTPYIYMHIVMCVFLSSLSVSGQPHAAVKRTE